MPLRRGQILPVLGPGNLTLSAKGLGTRRVVRDELSRLGHDLGKLPRRAGEAALLTAPDQPLAQALCQGGLAMLKGREGRQHRFFTRGHPVVVDGGRGLGQATCPAQAMRQARQRGQAFLQAREAKGAGEFRR